MDIELKEIVINNHPLKNIQLSQIQIFVKSYFN